MSVSLESKTRIDALTAAANAKTGASAANLTAAVQALMDGYGKGGLDPSYILIVVSEAPGIEAETFMENTLLERAEFPAAASIGDRAFYRCTNLRETFFYSVETIGNEAFVRCENLSALELPALTTIGYGAFRECSNVTDIQCPNVTSLREEAFSSCSMLRSITLPNIETIPFAAFRECMELQTADFASVRQIEDMAFENSAVYSLVLRQIDIVRLGMDALRGTAIEAGAGYIYVPSVMVEEYQTDPEWSTFAAQFRALEEYTMDGTTTGELDESRI